jgi:hypothetical protein
LPIGRQETCVLAYLDANSGSLIVSAIAGGIAGLFVVVKMRFRRFTALFSPTKRAELKAQKAATRAETTTTGA